MANRLASLAVLAILTFVPNSLQAQNSVANTAVPGSALTPKLMSKMLQLITLRGTDQQLPASYANAMGLSASGQTWPDRQIATRATLDNFIHAFSVSRGSDQDVVLYTRRSDSVHAFRAHRDGKVVTALIFDNQTSQITMRAPAETQNELDLEFALWARGVDKLIAVGHAN
jgi:hypothetical protein